MSQLNRVFAEQGIGVVWNFDCHLFAHGCNLTESGRSVKSALSRQETLAAPARHVDDEAVFQVSFGFRTHKYLTTDQLE
jgi:hypothetical protein